MVYRSSTEAGYGIGVSTDHVDASHTDRIDIADAELLFRGHFARSGPDLILTGDDGHRLVVTGYFAAEKHPDLVAPNGAHLNGDLVDLLAGSPTPGHYAQAKTTLPPEAIGKVEKAVGQVTLIHNGVAGPLHVGDPVYKTDVVQTGANSSCGIAFPDGTALDLVNNTRMALNEYNFEPNSAANGALFSLVEGTFAFVAGQVAHTGEGMKINTPVATMGIRGTVGLFRSEPTVINSTLGHIWSAFLHEDIDGSHHLGRIAFIDMDPTSPTFGQEFFLLDSSDYIAYFEPRGPGLAPNVRLEPITNSKVFDDRHFYDDLHNILSAYQTGQSNPGAIPGTPGSGDDPNSILNPLNLFDDLGGKPLFNSFQGPTGSSGPFVPPLPGLPIIPINQGQNPNPTIPTPTPNGPTTNGPNGPPSNTFIWQGGTGSWTLPNYQNQPGIPNNPIDIVEIPTGTVNYDNVFQIGQLFIGANGQLFIFGGSLTIDNGLTDFGAIFIEGDPPLLTVKGPTEIGAGGKIVDKSGEVLFQNGTFTIDGAGDEKPAGRLVARGRNADIDLSVTTLTNLGVVFATQHGTITIDANTVINGSATDTSALIEAARHGNITITELANGSENFGTILATDWGTITLYRLGSATNESTGVIAAVDHGRIFDNVNESTVNDGKLKAADGGEFFLKISGDEPNGVGGNYGTMEAVDGGHFYVTGGALANYDDIKSVGPCSTFDFSDMGIGNAKLILAADHGEMLFSQVQLENQDGGKIVAHDGSIFYKGGGITNDAGAQITADDHGKIVFASVAATEGDPPDLISVINHSGGQIEAKDYGIIEFVGLRDSVDGGGSVTNDGQMLAEDHGLIKYDDIAVTNNNWIGAQDGGTVVFDDVAGDANGGFFNNGTVAAIGWGSTVDFYHTDINGGTLKADGGTIFVSCDSTLNNGVNVFIADNGIAHFANAVGATGPVDVFFEDGDKHGTGTLALDKAPGNGLAIYDFGVGDTIDLTNIRFCSFGEYACWTQDDGYGTLTIHYGDGQTETLTLEGTYCSSDFALVSDPNGDTDVVFGRIDNWTSHYSGGWTFCGNWSSGVPTYQTTAEIEYSDITTSGTVVVCLDDHKEVVGNLLIGHHGELDIGDGGSLKVLNALDDEGKILVDGHNEDPILRLEGPVRVGDGAEITAEHCHAIVDFSFDEVGNDGEIKATRYGEITFDHATITNDSGGTIGATRHGTMHVDYSTVSNDGRMGAKDGGIFDVSHTTITQGCDGYILATGGEEDSHSLVNLYDATIIGGTLETHWGGFIQTVGGNSTFDGLTIACDSEIQVSDNTSLTLQHKIDNKGTVTLGGQPIGEGEHDGGGNTALVIDGWVTLKGHGEIVLSERGEQPNEDSIVSGDRGGTLDNVNNTISGAGTIGDCNLKLINGPCGIINANGDYADLSLVVDTGHNHVVNKGLMQATDGGVLVINSDVDNHGGTITAGDCSTVELAASVFGGTINDTGSDFNSVERGLLVDGNQTLDYGTLNIGNDCGGSLLRNVDLTGNGATLTLGCHLTIDQTGTAGIFSTFGTADVHDLVVSYATINTSDATFTIQPDYFTNYGQINADAEGGTLDIIPTSWFKNYGTVAISNGESATIGDGFVSSDQPGGVTNETGGMISVGEGSSLSIGNGSPAAEKAGIFVNDGTLAVNGGTAEMHGPVYGTGSDTVGDGGQLTFDSFVSSHQIVSFGETGKVVVTDSADFHASISDFAAGNTFDAADIAFSAGEYDVWTQTNGTGGTLQLFNASNVLEDTLNLNGTYAQNQFVLTADQGTGTDILIAGAHWAGPLVVDQPGDEWSNPNNWTDGNGHVVGVPTANTDVVIDEGGGYTVEVTDAEAAKSLTITPAGLGADVQDKTGGSLAITNALTIDAGSFSLIGGSLTAGSIYVGSEGHFIGEGTVTAPLNNDGGIVEAWSSGGPATLSLLGAVSGDGTYNIDNGNTLDFGSSVAGGIVNFGGTSGTVKVDAPASFGAEIALAQANPNEIIDLGGFGSNTGDSFTTSTSLNAGVTTLTVTDTSDHTSESVKLVGDFTGASWTVTADASGGADIADPPASADASGSVFTISDGAGAPAIQVAPGTPVVDAVTNVDGSISEFMLGNDQINVPSGQTVTDTHNNVSVPDPGNPGATVNTMSVSVGGAGNDTFVFAPGVGADTIVNFNAQQDTIELDHFANIQNLQELAASVTSDTHGNAVLELGHGDSVTVAGVSASYLQQHVQSLVHLH